MPIHNLTKSFLVIHFPFSADHQNTKIFIVRGKLINEADKVTKAQARNKNIIERNKTLYLP